MARPSRVVSEYCNTNRQVRTRDLRHQDRTRDLRHLVKTRVLRNEGGTRTCTCREARTDWLQQVYVILYSKQSGINVMTSFTLSGQLLHVCVGQ